MSMEGITVVRVIRQIRIVRYGTSVQQPNITQLAAPIQQQALPPTPQQNSKGINAFILMIIYTVGIGSIVIGAKNLKNCPIQEKLPEALIIFGALLMVARLLNCVYDCRSVCEDVSTENTPPCLKLLNLLFVLAEFGMFIAVCYWTFNIDPVFKYQEENPLIPIENNTNYKYCDYTLYKTSFYGSIVGLVFYGLCILCACCCSR